MTVRDKDKNKEEENILNKNEEDSFSENKEVLKKLDELLELNKKIAHSASYSERRLRNRKIIITIKWSLLGAVIVLGFISYSTIFDYARKYVDEYEDTFNKVKEQVLENK